MNLLITLHARARFGGRHPATMTAAHTTRYDLQADMAADIFRNGDQVAENNQKRHKSRVCVFFCFGLIFVRQHCETPSESLKSGKFGIFPGVPYICISKTDVPGGGGRHPASMTAAHTTRYGLQADMAADIMARRLLHSILTAGGYGMAVSNRTDGNHTRPTSAGSWRWRVWHPVSMTVIYKKDKKRPQRRFFLSFVESYN